MGIEKGLLRILAHLEASIDFCEQDITPGSYEQCLAWSHELTTELKALVQSYDIGKNLSGRWKVLLAGATNAGKSSLFNKLVGKDIAIVSDLHGTTRDPVVRDLYFAQQSLEFIDSAGFRENTTSLEKIGIQKTLEVFEECSVVLWVVDISVDHPNMDFTLPSTEKPIFLVFNKTDKLSAEHQKQEVPIIDGASFEDVIYVSAKSGQGIGDLKATLNKWLEASNNFSGKSTVTQARHYQHLQEILQEVEAGQQLFNSAGSPDLVAYHFQNALTQFNFLMGKEYDDEILDSIFSEFCLGK